MKRNKKAIYLSIVLLIGVGVSVFAYLTLQRSNLVKQETKEVIALNRSVYPYETINSADLKYIHIPKTADVTGYITDKYMLIGKVATTYLISGELVPEDLVIDKEKISHINFVTLKTDYTRTAGAKIGDVVDIYKVVNYEKDAQPETILVGENALVIDITDKEGSSIYDNSSNTTNALVGGSTKRLPVQAVKLAINNRAFDVKKIVEGSINGDSYVMVIKNSGGETLVLGGK